jgi:hypothetical protein
VLATILVLGTKVPRSAGSTGSTPVQRRRISFLITSQASGRSLMSAAKVHLQNGSMCSGISGLPSFPRFSTKGSAIVQGKYGLSDPIGTGGGQSAYRGSVFRETRSLPFFTVEIADRRNTENTFGAKPTVLAPGHIKRACERGQPPL